MEAKDYKELMKDNKPENKDKEKVIDYGKYIIGLTQANGTLMYLESILSLEETLNNNPYEAIHFKEKDEVIKIVDWLNKGRNRQYNIYELPKPIKANIE